MTPEFSQHARQRWEERCTGLDLAREWLSARKATHAQRQKIATSCPHHAELAHTRAYRGVWYAVSRMGVVFVVGQDKRIVTVLRL